MIYALRKNEVDEESLNAIRTAITNKDSVTLKTYAEKLVIRHVNDVSPGKGTWFCIYCKDIVYSSGWYFKHDENKTCIGTADNPASRGCYVAKQDEQRNPRTKCNCTAYCHHAQQWKCI